MFVDFRKLPCPSHLRKVFIAPKIAARIFFISDGINANVVCPLAWTAQLENFEKAYPDAFKANVHTPPMGHFGDVEKEIGRVCVQLASPDFKYMSGETLTLEGALGQRP